MNAAGWGRCLHIVVVDEEGGLSWQGMGAGQSVYTVKR